MSRGDPPGCSLVLVWLLLMPVMWLALRLTVFDDPPAAEVHDGR